MGNVVEIVIVVNESFVIGEFYNIENESHTVIIVNIASLW